MAKLYFFNLILGLLIFNSLGNDEFFAKFHQSDYKVKDMRIEMKSFNADYYNFFNVVTFKHNRSVPAVNASLNTKMDINGQELELLVQVYKFASNEYRIFPIRFQVNLWKALNANIAGLQLVFKCGNMPFDNFFFKKGVTYSVCNLIFDFNRLPPLMPTGRYMTEASYLKNDIRLVTLLLFGEAYHEVVY